jgi:cytochrome P450
LLRTPAALERLTDEIETGKSDEYLDAVVKETLRLRPVVPEVFRAPADSSELGGYLFPSGTQLAASILLVQFNSDLYPPDPETSGPSASTMGRRSPTPGCRSAAAYVAVSVPHSRPAR